MLWKLQTSNEKCFFFNNNKNKKKLPAYLQDNNIFCDSGLPEFPVKQNFISIFSVTKLLHLSSQSIQYKA